MSNKETVWIDMTDLSSWQGNFTGIQRVVYNIAKGYDKEGGAKYFVFDPIEQKFLDFDFKSFRSIIESSQHTSTQAAAHGSTKTRLKNKAKQVYLHAPSSLKKIATPSRLKKILRIGRAQYLHVRHLKRRVSRLFDKQPAHTIEFSEGEKILVLGNSWDRPNLLMNLGEIKKHKEIKIFQVVYDLIPVFQPQAFNEELFNSYTRNMFEVATISDGLLAISKSTKKDMIRFCSELNISPPPIQVIRLGDDIPSSQNPRPPQGLTANDEFVLCVGTIEARKNHALLYYSWKEGIKRGLQMPKLIIVGRPGWYTGDIVHYFQTDPEMVNRVQIFNNVSDDELVWLYSHCAFTVYPSYYEGWGLPVAESLAMGKVCLASDVSSMPEVGESLCVYHSPFSTEEFLVGMELLSNASKRKKLEQTIKENYATTKWEATYLTVRQHVEAS